MRVVAYDADGGAASIALEAAAALAADPVATGFVSVALDDPSAEDVRAVKAAFAVPDTTPSPHRRRSRPSLAIVGDRLLLAIGTAHYDDEAETVETGEITLWSGPRFVVVVRRGRATTIGHGPADVGRRADLLRHGPFAVVLDLVDDVVDAFIPVAEGVDDDIGELEDEVFSPTRTNAAERIYRLKRETLGFHRVILGLDAALERLLERDLVVGELRPRFTAVRDHLDRVADRVAAQRDLLTSVLDAHLAQLSVRQNDDMRRISAWVAIAAVPTAIAAIYGMNFRHMPELGWRYGYLAVIVVMALACLALYRAFRRSGWL